MVGVPGRSKGCHTCRRRKIKCDLGEPHCQRCIKSNKQCEGYAKLPVFLNRTAQGLVRRAPLEEAVITKGRDSPSGQSSKSKDDEEDSSLVEAFQLMPRTIDNSRAYINKLEGEFCRLYVPSDFAPGANPPGAYVASVISGMTPSQRGMALDFAARALWMSRLGRLQNQKSLLVQAELAYGAALRYLQEALYNTQLAAKDKTFAAASILSVYELYESTVKSVKGHDNHISGLVRLLQWRGKKNVCKTLLGQRLMELTRWDAMVASIQYRKRSVLGDLEWRGDSWITITDIEQRLYDRGFDVGAMLEDTDSLSKMAGNQDLPPGEAIAQRMTAMEKVIKQITDLDDSLETWHEKFQTWYQAPVYWKERPEPTKGKSHVRIITFPNLRLCHMLLDFWALHIIVGTVMATLFARLPTQVQSSPNLRPFSKRVERHDHAYVVSLADLIIDGAQYSLREEMGLVGPHRSIFGVRVALFCFRVMPGEHAARQRMRCEEFMRTLTLERGIQFARDVSGGADASENSPEYKYEAFNNAVGESAYKT